MDPEKYNTQVKQRLLFLLLLKSLKIHLTQTISLLRNQQMMEVSAADSRKLPKTLLYRADHGVLYTSTWMAASVNFLPTEQADGPLLSMMPGPILTPQIALVLTTLFTLRCKFGPMAAIL